MKRFLYSGILFLCFSSVAVAQLTVNPQPALTPLYSANQSSLTDNFYTIKVQDHATALGIGYTNTGVLAYMEKSQQPNTMPFKRFYKAAPQYEHFYTAKTDEANLVMANGWQYEGIEGYIYTTQVPGSVPMYRAAYFNSSNGDLVHKYTLNYQELQQLLQQGWGNVGVQGYVYTTPNPRVDGGVILGLRCPSAAANACLSGLPNFRDYYFGSVNVSATVKTGSMQRMRFNFWSPNLFSDTGHFALILHGNFSLGSPNSLVVCPNGQPSASCSWHRGLGMAIFGGGSQAYSEAFYVTGNQTKQASTSSGSLLNNQLYSLDLHVSDQGVASYTITQAGSNSLLKADTWYASSVYPAYSPFPTELTGYAIANATDTQRDFTLYITNLVVDWIP